MKYLTKELYIETQIFGFINLPASKEKWDEEIKSYEEIGIDIIKNLKNEIEYRKTDLLKFLPVALHPLIHNATLMTEYPSCEVKEILVKWCDDFEKNLQKVRQELEKCYDSNKFRLPKNVVRLYESSLHDANVISFKYISEKQECVIVLNNLEDSEERCITLTFTGIDKLSVDNNIEGASWVYNEVYSDDDYFELHILFESPLTDFYIRAQDIQMEKHCLD